MKKRIFSLVLTVAMLLCVMPFAVSAAEKAPVTNLDLTYNQEITNQMSVGQANSTFQNTSYLKVSQDSHLYHRGGSLNKLFVYENEQYKELLSSDMVDATTNYWVHLYLTTMVGYELGAKVKAGDFSDFTLTINGTVRPLTTDGTTHHVLDRGNNWMYLLLPLSYFTEVQTPALITTFDITPTTFSVKKGTSYTISTNVVGVNGADTGIIWSLKQEGSNVPTSNDTRIEDGVVTIGADEKTTLIIGYATSKHNPSTKKTLYIYTTDEAPVIESIVFDNESIDVFPGDYVYQGTQFSFNGTEKDNRLEFSLTGGTKSGTKIAYTYDSYVSIQIDKNETADTLLLTVTSVVDPTKFDTLTINVKKLSISEGDFYFNLDYSKISFDTSVLETDVQSALKNNRSVDTINTVGLTFNNPYIMLQSYRYGNWYGANGNVDISKDYYYLVYYRPETGYGFSEKIKSGDFSDVNIYINGTEAKIEYIEYNSGYNEIRAYITPEGLFDADFTGASLSLGSDLSMNYFVKHNDVENLPLNKMAVQFTINERTILVKDYTIVDGEYVFTLKGIAPQEACDNISASIVELNDDGVTVKRVVRTKANYSVSDNIGDLKKAYSEDEDMLALLKDLIWYCEFAQRYLDYTPNGSIRQAFSSFAGNETPTYSPDASDNVYALDNVLVSGSRLTAAGVRFSSDNKLYVKVNAAETVTLVVKKAGVVVDTVTLDAGVHTYYTEGILATEFDVVYTFELTVGESATPAQTLTYSVNSYAIRTATKTEYGAPSRMANLARALYNYGKACEAFVAAP